MIGQDLFVRFNCKIHRWGGGEVREIKFSTAFTGDFILFLFTFFEGFFGFFHAFIFVGSREEGGGGLV